MATPAGEVVGSVGEGNFRLRVTIWYRNSFQTVLHGSFVSDGHGTKVICRFGTSYFVNVFMAVWFLGLLGMGGAAAIGSGDLVLIGMVVFGVGLVTVGRYLARNEQQKLIEFLRDTIAAKEI